MIAAILRARALAVCALLVLAGMTSGRAQTPVTTWHYDNSRSGANPNETILTPQNVNKTQFGKLFTQPVDGQVIGQALYLPQVTIPKLGVHNVVYVPTMNDSVYAFDADGATGSNAKPLWHTTFLINGATAVPIKLQGAGGVTGWTEVGIVSTPVIDQVAGTLYVVAKTYEKSKFVHRLHALISRQAWRKRAARCDHGELRVWRQGLRFRGHDAGQPSSAAAGKWLCVRRFWIERGSGRIGKGMGDGVRRDDAATGGSV